MSRIAYHRWVAVFGSFGLVAWALVESCAKPPEGRSPAPSAPPSAQAPSSPPVSPRPPNVRNAQSMVGYNLDYPGDWSGLVPFIDLMKNARAWTGNCVEGDNECDGVSQLSLDEHGWVRSLEYRNQPGRAYEYVETVVLTNNGQPGFDRELVVDYKGSGEIELTNAEVLRHDAAQRRIVFKAQNGSVFLRLRASEPRDYLRQIRVFRADQEAALARGELFNPEMLEYLSPFGSLRFMDWMEGNQPGICSGGPEHGKDCYAAPGDCSGGRCVMAGVWQERPRADQASLLSRSQFIDSAHPERGVRVGGYPVETMVALANAAGADPHFNFPAAFEDDHARRFATYVKDQLAPNLRATIEYSNETWNWGFPQAKYVNVKGRELWPDEGSAWVQYAGSRMQHLCRIWKEVFGEQKHRVRCLISPQTGWPDMARAMLDCPAWAKQHPELGACYDGSDAIAITGYFSGCLQQPHNEQKLRAWLGKGKAHALDRFFEQLERGGLLSCAEEGDKTALVDVIQLYQLFARMAQSRGLELYAYESGTHFNYEGKDPNVERLFIEASRDPRMGDLYSKNLAAFKRAGGTIINAWGWIGSEDMWANADHVNDRAHPKYRALFDFAMREPCGWARCDRSQR